MTSRRQRLQQLPDRSLALVAVRSLYRLNERFADPRHERLHL
jgi:hypothetical protein